MVMRQLGKDQSERMKNIEESVEKAKEAVQLDISDGTSWCKPIHYSCPELFNVCSFFLI